MPSGRKIPRSPNAPVRRPPPPTDDTEPDPVLRKVAGELTAAWSQIRTCRACDRACDDRAYGTGHPMAPIMLVKERPSPEDLEASNAFTSEAEALGKAFEALGVPTTWL
jgi:uracil-DNA glycosylase